MMITTIILQVLFLALLAQFTATAAVVELNDENWLESVQGKSVFVFFDEFEVRYVFREKKEEKRRTLRYSTTTWCPRMEP